MQPAPDRIVRQRLPHPRRHLRPAGTQEARQPILHPLLQGAHAQGHHGHPHRHGFRGRQAECLRDMARRQQHARRAQHVQHRRIADTRTHVDRPIPSGQRRIGRHVPAAHIRHQARAGHMRCHIRPPHRDHLPQAAIGLAGEHRAGPGHLIARRRRQVLGIVHSMWPRHKSSVDTAQQGIRP